MERGVVLIAVGHPHYGQLSLNLALSIIHNEAIPITILCDETAVSTLDRRILASYDITLQYLDESLVRDNGKIKIGRLKTQLYDLSPYQHTIFLDSDSLICPDKKISEWFDWDAPFLIPYEHDTHTDTINPQHSHWLKFEYVKKNFKVVSAPYVGSYQTSVIVFRKEAITEALFSQAFFAHETVEKHFGTVGGWYGTIPDELCFWIASATTGYMPKANIRSQIYFGHAHNSSNRGWILGHKIVTFPSAQNRLVGSSKDLYNELSMYYKRKITGAGLQWKDKGSLPPIKQLQRK